MQPRARTDPQKQLTFLRLADQLKAEATGLASFCRPGPIKLMRGLAWISETGVSRACNRADASPWYRAAAWLVAIRALGGSRAKAERLVEWLHGLIDVLWSDDAAIDWQAEAEADSAEELAQVAAMTNPDRLPEWLEAKALEIATGKQAVAAGRRKLYAEATS